MGEVYCAAGPVGNKRSDRTGTSLGRTSLRCLYLPLLRARLVPSYQGRVIRMIALCRWNEEPCSPPSRSGLRFANHAQQDTELRLRYVCPIIWSTILSIYPHISDVFRNQSLSCPARNTLLKLVLSGLTAIARLGNALDRHARPSRMFN